MDLINSHGSLATQWRDPFCLKQDISSFLEGQMAPKLLLAVDAVVLRDQKKEIIQMQEVDPEIRCFFPIDSDAYISKKISCRKLHSI